MAGKSNKSDVVKTPILNTDGNSEEFETYEDMETPEKATLEKETIIKSRKKMSFNEFCVIKNLRVEVKAGFEVWLKGEYFHFEDEWNRLFEDYTNRPIKIRR